MASQGQIHTVFQTGLQDLAKQAGEQAEMIRGRGTRPWNYPSVPSGGEGEQQDAAGGGEPPGPLDIAGITDCYNRDEIDTNYASLIQSGDDMGTCGDVISVKTQGDYIAEMERGFRARHATPVRCIGHAMARRKGHSQDNGIFMGGALKHVQDAWKSGQDT
jgi:hypothetical protein